MTALDTLALPPALHAPQPGWQVGNQTARACPSVSTSRRARAASLAATVHWRGCGVGGLEGVPRRNGVYQRFARYGRVQVYVWAFFGRAHPTASRLAAANAELATVRLHW